MESWLAGKCVLITGGTSGLGRSLALKFLSHGCRVVTIGRTEGLQTDDVTRYQHYQCDFADFVGLKSVVKRIIADCSIDILINNAGILSPPRFQQSKNGLELSYQVNFLAHYYLSTSLVSNGVDLKCIVNVSSPVHTKGQLDLRYVEASEHYKLLPAYANSKLYMALLSQFLHEKGLDCFSFDPGTFSSGIYRAQQKWFHLTYKVAAPFMTSSDKVANGLVDLMTARSWTNAKMYNRRSQLVPLLKFDPIKIEAFWNKVEQQLSEVSAKY